MCVILINKSKYKSSNLTFWEIIFFFLCFLGNFWRWTSPVYCNNQRFGISEEKMIEKYHFEISVSYLRGDILSFISLTTYNIWQISSYPYCTFSYATTKLSCILFGSCAGSTLSHWKENDAWFTINFSTLLPELWISAAPPELPWTFYSLFE